MSDRFEIRLPVQIRPCREQDLPALEWFGLETDYRDYMARGYRRQQTGELVFLVAEANGFPVAKIWIDLRVDPPHAALLSALDVMPCFRNLGLATRLIGVAEERARAARRDIARMTVAQDNPRARRLYERLGYRSVGQDQAVYDGVSPDGRPIHHDEAVWVMEKSLRQGANCGTVGS
jgi:ribosomal protein S18 acetylase RimI-like enzyme